MTSNNIITFSSIVASILLCVAIPNADASVFSSGATWSSRGWKLSYATDVTPDASVRIYSDVIHIDEGGKPVFHRIFIDPSNSSYCGYDVIVEVTNSRAHVAAIHLVPLKLTADQVREALTRFMEGHPGRSGGLTQEVLARLQLVRIPRVSSETFSSEETLALNVMDNPVTGQRVTDYIKISWNPEPWMLDTGDVVSPPRRDLKVTDVNFHVVGGMDLWVNDHPVKRAIVADNTFDSNLLEIYIAGYGRFFLSLDPRSKYGFDKLGEIRGRVISFVRGDDHFELRTRGDFVSSFGVWNLYVLAKPLTEGSSTSAIEFWYAPVNDLSDIVNH